MHKSKPPFLHFALCACALIQFGCSASADGPAGPEEPRQPRAAVALVRVSPATDTLTDSGSAVQLTATVYDANGAVLSGRSVTWASSDRAVVAVSSSGVATARGDGAGAVTATSEGVSGSAVLIVRIRVRFTQVVLGERHTCALAEDGRAFCWGSNEYGQLGAGETPSGGNCTTVACKTPVEVQGGLHFSLLVSGRNETCGVSVAGETYC